MALVTDSPIPDRRVVQGVAQNGRLFIGGNGWDRMLLAEDCFRQGPLLLEEGRGSSGADYLTGADQKIPDGLV